jgi:hypothetical protein
MADETICKQRGPGRPFKPGVSGNPSGRPRGSRNKTTVLVEKLLADDAEAVARSVIDAARAGDMTAARIVLDRLCPVRRDQPVEIDLPSITGANDALAAMGVVLDAVAGGSLTPSEDEAVSFLLDRYLRAIEINDLEARISRLEGASA